MIYPLTTLEGIFQIVDMEGLLALGAPADEYDAEAARVQVALEALGQADVSYAGVSTVVANVWQDSFGPFDEEGWHKRLLPVLQRLVQRILDQWPPTTKPLITGQPTVKHVSVQRRPGH